MGRLQPFTKTVAAGSLGIVAANYAFLAPISGPKVVVHRGASDISRKTAAGAGPWTSTATAGASQASGVLAHGLRGLAAVATAAIAGASRGIRRTMTRRKAIAVGDQVPDVSLDDGFPPKPFPLREFCGGKKVVLMGLPGAFTTT